MGSVVPSALTDERFEIDRAIRSGGMSTVYKAIDKTTGAPVALKVLSSRYQEEGERFEREAMALETLRHPGIVRYVAHGRGKDDSRWLAMEWLEGVDLAGRLEKGPLSIQDSIALAARVAGALAVTHAHGMVHRDIKPSNLFLPEGKPERVKLIDFGIVRVADRAELTGPGVIFGTPGYMAPEQARGERRIDARVDVYALGCVLFECITGRPVFTGAHPTAILAKVVLEEAPRLRNVMRDAPDVIDRLVARMLSKIAESRPRDARALSAEIEELGRTQQDQAPASIPSLRSEALGEQEQRLVTVVMTSPVPQVASDETLAIGEDLSKSVLASIRAAINPLGARIEGLRNGSLVASLLGTGSATDQAAVAARCALILRSFLPDVEMVLAMGRGVVGARLPVGDVIDRAVDMLREANPLANVERPRPVGIDRMTAALLDARFDVAKGAGQEFLLRAEIEPVDATRTLLGRPTPCVGRERELALLDMLLEESVTEPVARAVLVTAAAGMGKSRVRHEFLRHVRERHGQGPLEIWTARGDAMAAGSPFALISQIVRHAAGVREDQPLDMRREKLRESVHKRVPQKRAARVTQFLGELVGARFPDDASVHLRAARQDAMLMGDQMRAAWEDYIDAESAAHPVMIVLEDLHWGDLPSVQYIDSALRNLRDRPVFVFALARPEVSELFPKLWAGRGMQEIRLGELSPKMAGRLVREVLGDRATDDIVAKLVERAAGNAFYLEELIRAVAEGRGEELPDTVVAMVQARLERMEPDARRVLRAASVFGQVFWRGGVLSLLGGAEEAARRDGWIDEWIDELVARETISKRPQAKFANEHEFVFRHAMVREAAYAMLTSEDKKLGHLLAGGFLEKVEESDAMVLAEHLERGGAHGRAVNWYRRAAEHAMEGNDFEGVIARAERAVGCGADGDVLGALRVIQAEANRWRGDLAGAEGCGLDGMRLLPRCTPLWFNAVGDLALASGRRGKIEQLEVLGKMLVDLGGLRSITGPHAIAAARAATQLLLAGKQDLADRLIADVERIAKAEEEASPAVRARIAVARAHRAFCSGDAAGAIEFVRAAAEGFESVGDLRSAVGQRGDLGYALIELGEYEPAVSTLKEVIATSERLGRVAYPMGVARGNLGLALARRGELEEAKKVELQALNDFAAKGDRRMEGKTRICLAEIHLLMGNLDAAEEDADTAVEMLAHSPPALAHAMAMSAHVALARGNKDDALEAAREADRLLQEVGVLDEGESLVRLVLAEALHENGLQDEADKAIEVALDRLEQRAAKIEDPGRRESFLSRVPENARTIEHARAWIPQRARK